MSEGQHQRSLELGGGSAEDIAQKRRRDATASRKYRDNRNNKWQQFANEAQYSYANSQLSDDWQKIQNYLIRAVTETAERQGVGVAGMQGALEPWFEKIRADIQMEALSGAPASESFKKGYLAERGWEAPSWRGPRAKSDDTASASAQPLYGLPTGLSDAVRIQPGRPYRSGGPPAPSHGEPASYEGQRPQLPTQPDVVVGRTLPLPVPSQNARFQLHQPVGSDVTLPPMRPDVASDRVLPPLVRNPGAVPGNRPYSPPPGLRHPDGPKQGKPQSR